VVGIGAVLTLARFSEAFLILRAQSAGLSLALAPLVLVVMNIVYALSAYPLGALDCCSLSAKSNSARRTTSRRKSICHCQRT
jgi:hypothetical protein